MARYTGPKTKISRIFGEPILGNSKSLSKNSNPPGQHGAARKRKSLGEYALQLREKQKARRFYGVQERQFRRYFATAQRVKGMTGVTLLQTLERRLDNVIYRLGIADSRPQARQLVRHGHFTLNGQNHNVPSYLVKAGDVIAVKDNSRGNGYFKTLADHLGQRAVPEWLQFDENNWSARIIGLPDRQGLEIPLKEQLIVEYYSR